MNKTTKGALAAGSAAVLLAGGAGSLAYWTDDATVNGGSVTAGYLTIDPLVVAPNTAACDTDWVYANGTNAGATVLNFVPGDQVTKDCTFTIRALGDNLEASPTVPDTVTVTPAPAAPSFDATVAATYAVPDRPITATDTITEADNNKTLTASILVTIPFGSTSVNTNDTQEIVASLSDLTVSLEQDLGTGNPNS